MTNEEKNQYDDFFANSSFSSSESELSETFLQYCDFMNNIPSKIKNDKNFDSWKYFTEIAQSKALYRKRNDAPLSLAVYWLSQIRSMANIIFATKEIPKLSFTEKDLSNLSHESEDEKELPLIAGKLFEHGIILLYLESLSGMKLDGASFLLNDKVPVIGMTLRYNRIDNYWFTLFHELSHIILHYDQLKSAFFDDLDEEKTSDIEIEADGLAQVSLIPRYKWRSCNLHYDRKPENVYNFANELHIHPAIVAGRYEKENNNYTIFSSIVNKTDTREILL
jgi:HTH-type transcriptional regulator / antitoxin HigA